ncbi:hypothetical protein GCM10028803_32940 [Larkinella knui]
MNAGGLAEFRSIYAEEKDFAYLQGAFSKDLVTLKKVGVKGKLKHQYQKTIKLPF